MLKKSLGQVEQPYMYPPGSTNMAGWKMETFEDVFAIEHGDVSLPCYFTGGFTVT